MPYSSMPSRPARKHLVAPPDFQGRGLGQRHVVLEQMSRKEQLDVAGGDRLGRLQQAQRLDQLGVGAQREAQAGSPAARTSSKSCRCRWCGRGRGRPGRAWPAARGRAGRTPCRRPSTQSYGATARLMRRHRGRRSGRSRWDCAARLISTHPHLRAHQLFDARHQLFRRVGGVGHDARVRRDDGGEIRVAGGGHQHVLALVRGRTQRARAQARTMPLMALCPPSYGSTCCSPSSGRPSKPPTWSAHGLVGVPLPPSSPNTWWRARPAAGRRKNPCMMPCQVGVVGNLRDFADTEVEAFGVEGERPIVAEEAPQVQRFEVLAGKVGEERSLAHASP